MKRNGPWRIRQHSVANNVMGSIKLDLTQATFDASVVEISGTHLMGAMTVRVPLGTNVRDETTKVLGDTSIKDIGDPDPAMPTIVITGTNIFSEIKVRGPKKPPRWHVATFDKLRARTLSRLWTICSRLRPTAGSGSRRST